MTQKLKTVGITLDEWCQKHDVPYIVVCDETDLRGVMLLRKERALIRQLVDEMEPLLRANDIHLETRKVRGGIIMALSLKALSESELTGLISNADEEPEELTFEERVSDAFLRYDPAELSLEDQLLQSACRIAEAQYHSATAGATRANQSTRQRQMYTSNTTHSGAEHPTSPKANEDEEKPNKSKALPFESKLLSAFDLTREYRNPAKFRSQLHEALSGMATPTGEQPADLFQKFAKALAVLGQQMGIGPLQDKLKEQGINWKKSDDGQSIILFIQNAQTGAPQPIARLGAETLDKPNEFETQLFNMIDFSKGEAPGAFKQQQDAIRAQEKAVRDIAKSVAPPDPSSASLQMNQLGQPMQQQAQPATATAAQQAGMPKDMATPAVGSLPRRSA